MSGMIEFFYVMYSVCIRENLGRYTRPLRLYSSYSSTDPSLFRLAVISVFVKWYRTNKLQRNVQVQIQSHVTLHIYLPINLHTYTLITPWNMNPFHDKWFVFDSICQVCTTTLSGKLSEPQWAKINHKKKKHPPTK